MIDFISALVTALTGTVAGNALGFFAGLWLGYRLDLNKAKRAEFNAAVVDVRGRLVQVLADSFARRVWLDAAQLDAITQRMALWQRHRFSRDWAEYQRVYQQGVESNALGERLYTGDRAALDRAAQRALRHLRLR